jgi:glutamyl-tRNA reductase
MTILGDEGISVYPVSLLISGRPCLIIGGGKVAARKLRGLLDAGARVTVVSPDLDVSIAEQLEQGSIRYEARNFAEHDLDRNILVYAATGDKALNKRVLELCRERNIFCCAVDGNWRDGDFVTPATLRKGTLSVAISTGGQSCRRSRMIKDNLARHIEMVESANCLVIGTSHHEMELQAREPLHATGARLHSVGHTLMHMWGVHEFLLLDTCNRIELVAITAKDAPPKEVLQGVMGFAELDEEQFYFKRGFEAFEHLCLVAAGLLSQMLGEYHIVAQLKASLDLATKQGWAAALMQDWVASTLHISKRIRRELPDRMNGAEIEDACASYITEFVASRTPRVCVIGTGVVGQALVQRLLRMGYTCDWVYHQRPPSLPAEPDSTQLQVVPWSELLTSVARADVIVAATAADRPVLNASDIAISPEISGGARDAERLFLDLSRPRNIDPDIGTLQAGLRLLDLDDLKYWYWNSIGTVEAILATGRDTVTAHRGMYEQLLRALQGEVTALQGRDTREPARAHSD